MKPTDHPLPRRKAAAALALGAAESKVICLWQMVFKRAMNFPQTRLVRVHEWPLSPSMLLCCVKCWQTSEPRPSGSDLKPRTSPSPYEVRGFFCLKFECSALQWTCNRVAKAG